MSFVSAGIIKEMTESNSDTGYRKCFCPIIVTVVCVHEERYTGITNCLDWTVQDGQNATVKVMCQPKRLNSRIRTNRIWKVSFDKSYFHLDVDYQRQFHLSLR